MSKYYIEFDAESFGITGKSLRKLRNILCQNFDEEVAIVYVATGGITGGFLVIVPNQSRAYWSGDGFRHDNGGEGGRGYQAACRLIKSLGFDIQDDVTAYAALFEITTKPFTGSNDQEDVVRSTLKDVVLAIEQDLTFKDISQLIPHY